MKFAFAFHHSCIQSSHRTDRPVDQPWYPGKARRGCEITGADLLTLLSPPEGLTCFFLLLRSSFIQLHTALEAGEWLMRDIVRYKPPSLGPSSGSPHVSIALFLMILKSFLSSSSESPAQAAISSVACVFPGSLRPSIAASFQETVP